MNKDRFDERAEDALIRLQLSNDRDWWQTAIKRAIQDGHEAGLNEGRAEVLALLGPMVEAVESDPQWVGSVVKAANVVVTALIEKGWVK